jgi:hypothetical protein
MRRFKLYRRTLLTLWMVLLAYFAFALIFLRGWVGAGWVLMTWSVAAIPLYIASYLFWRRAGPSRGSEFVVTLLVWALVSIIVQSAYRDSFGSTWLAALPQTFVTLASGTLATLITWRACSIVNGTPNSLTDPLEV